MLGGTCNERTFNEILMILQIQSSHTILKLPEKLLSRERVRNYRNILQVQISNGSFFMSNVSCKMQNAKCKMKLLMNKHCLVLLTCL